MWVEYEFQLNEKYFKIIRQGAFTKEETLVKHQEN